MATTARLGIDIVATNRTRNGFAATQRGLAGINRSMQQLKVLAGAFAGGNLLAGFVRSITSINAKVPEVSAAFTTLQRAWQAFALAIGEAGFSRALVDFATRMSTLVVGSNGLAQALSRLMSGTLSVLGGAFEGVARAINFAYDNFEILKRALYAFAAVQVAGMIINIGRALVLLISSLRAASVATGLFTLIQRRMLLFWTAIIALGAKLTGTFDDLVNVMNRAFEAAEELLPVLGDSVVDAIKRMGLDVKSLTQDFTAFEGSLAGLPQTFAEVNAQAKTFEKVDKPVNLLEGVKELKQELEPMPSMAEDLGRAFSQAFQSLIFDGAKATDVLRGLLDQIFQLSFQMLGQIGGSAGFGNAGGSLFGKLFGGFFAGGGHLGAGKWGIAGEHGPEIVHGPANISPMGGMAVTVINQNGSRIDSRETSGGLEIRVFDDAMSRAMSDPNSKTARTLRGLGLAPAVRRR